MPNVFCERDKPLLDSLVKSNCIKDAAFKLLADGALPADGYGHELYVCPKCHQLANRFYFKLETGNEQFEPDYHCSKCKTLLRWASLMHDDEGHSEVIYKNKRKADWKCPECGCEGLIYDGDFMMWD